MSDRPMTLAQLCDALAASAGTTPAEARSFVEGIVSIVEEILGAAGTVKIRHLGSFQPPTPGNPLFVPDPALADAVNAPFALFSPVALAPALTDSDLAAMTAPTESSEPPLAPQPSESSECSKSSEPPSRGVLWPWIAAAALLAGLIIGYCSYSWINLKNVESVSISANHVQVVQTPAPVEAPPIPTDTLKAEPSEVQAEEENPPAATKVITDTVRPGRFLTTMAKHHYGKKKFWVYIYLENKALIANPDILPSGLVLTIPPAERYQILPGNPASEARADSLAREILP